MKKINYKHYVLELLVVFISITLAFMLDNWSSSQRNQIMLKEYFESLIIDINSDLTTLESSINNIEEILSSYAKMIEFQKIEAPNDSIYFYLDAVLGSEKLNSNKSTFESLISSGNINLISKIEIKKKIFKVYGLYDDAELSDKANYDYRFSTIIPFLNDYINLITFEGLEESISTRDFANILVTGKGFNQGQLESYNKLKEGLTQLLIAVKEEIE
ncbi:hypothetical protein ACFLYJ_03595 [Candidatus Cloacimonadota bacterium]